MQPALHRIAVVIVSYNVRERLLRSVASAVAAARRTRELWDGVDVDVWVIDNASSDGSVFAVRQTFPDVTVVSLPTNVGFGRAVNEGVRRSSGDLVLLLNPDAELPEDAVFRMARRMDADADVGVLGVRQVDDQDRYQLSVGPRPSLLGEVARKAVQTLLDRDVGWARRIVDATLWRRRDVAWVAASCMMVRRASFEAIGGFDPDFFLYFEDIDLCLRIRACGERVVYDPTVTIHHQRGVSAATDRRSAMRAYRQSQERFWRKHGRGAESILAASYAALRGRFWIGG